MTKILPFMLLIMMVLHLIRPFGVYGLKRRGDFWKIAVAAIAVMMATVIVSTHFGF